MAASIIVSFFNVNDYELPKRYLQETLEHALSTGREVIFTQAVLQDTDFSHCIAILTQDRIRIV